ncbi:MAG: restriction endonuclease subunit [Bacteroidetes bacterium]|nr:restriction endonuclease subunit [Bacteroidota bacterium]
MKFGLEIQVIENIISVLEQHPKVDKAFVFGSRAKGNYRPDSDIDIAIKGNEITTDDIIAISVAIETIGITHKFDIIDYNSIKEPALKEHIDRVGIEFYSRWKEYKLDEIAEIHNAKRKPLSSMQRETRKGCFPYYGASGIIDNINDYLFDGEYVLISEDGENLSSRQTPIAFKATGKFWVNNHAHIVRGKDDHLNDLIIYFFAGLDLTPYITGAVQPKLSKENLLSIPIWLPKSIQEQAAIASILSSLDDKIDLLNRQNKTLEQLAETLFRQWFVEEAEESWETVAVGSFVKTNIKTITKEYSFQEIEYLDTSSLTEGIITETKKIFLKDAPSRAKRLVQNNDILISTVRPDQKHYGIINNPAKNLVVSTGFCVITCTKINPYFIYLLLTSNEMTQYLHSIAEGSTSTYPSLKPSDIEKIEFSKPPMSRIIKFGNLAANYWTKIHNNQTQIRTLIQTRNTLLPRLMSGEVRVEM